MSATAKQQLEVLAKTLRTSADSYQTMSNSQNKNAALVELLSLLDEEKAQSSLHELMVVYPGWFPS